jgi:hypothetical protein
VTADRRHKHLVIGAGFAGLGVCAAFVRRGVPFDCVDADDDVGGNWYHGVYESAHIISSKRTTEYADYPMPADYPDFPSAAQMLAYLRAYADHHRLRAHIELETFVEQVAPEPDGTWKVTLRGGQTRRYGGVVIANGHHWDRRFPRYPGELTIERIHSKDYKSAKQLEGRRVLTVGGGNSACDLAVEAAIHGRSSDISLRRGYWFLPKTFFGVPAVELMRPWMPLSMQRMMLKSLLKVTVGRYADYGLPEPDHEIFDKHPTINSQLLYFLKHGRIRVRPDIARWDGDHVVFADGSREPFDLVVCATGFHVSLPMLAEGVVEWEGGFPKLVRGLLSPTHANLYTFGLGQPRYGAGPLITKGADVLCTMIEVQRQLAHPLGAVLHRMGVPYPTTWLQDPFEVLRNLERAERVLRRLPKLERLVMRGRRRRDVKERTRRAPDRHP